MLEPSNLPESWPPSPHTVPEPPTEPQSDSLQGWRGAALLGLAGAVAGAVLLPLALLVLAHIIGDGDSPVSFLIALAVVAAIGAVGGFICGLAVWSVVRLILRREGPKT